MKPLPKALSMTLSPNWIHHSKSRLAEPIGANNVKRAADKRVPLNPRSIITAALNYPNLYTAGQALARDNAHLETWSYYVQARIIPYYMGVLKSHDVDRLPPGSDTVLTVAIHLQKYHTAQLQHGKR